MLSARTAWIAQEIWSLIVPVLLLSRTSSDQMTKCTSPAKLLLLCMFCTHYFYRSLVYPFRIRSGQPTPACICLMAAAFCAINGLLQGWWLLREPAPASGSVFDSRFLAGCLCWVAGWAINVDADARLRGLRKPGQTGYSIPRGGMFEYVSCANYLGEIVEWSGWALAAHQLPAVAFAFFTACNIGPRAWQHHQDYKNRFGNTYPRHRRALIPWLW